MTEPTVTPEQVMAEGVTRHDAAGRLAEYANLRASGAGSVDAAKRVGITNHRRYERWLTRWRDEQDLPALPESPTQRYGSRLRSGQGWCT